MKRILAILLTLVPLLGTSTTTQAIPEGTIARLGKGRISSADRAVQFSPDRTLLAVATSIGVWLYDAQTHNEIVLLETTAPMYSVAFSPDGSLLASGSGEDDTIKLWDVSERKLIDTLTGHTEIVSSVSFSPDGRMLASGSYDKTIKLWDVSERKLIDTLTGHTNLVTSVSFSPNGNLLASGSRDGTVLLWDMSGYVPTISKEALTSPTHPSEEKWYASPDVRFTWQKVEGVIGYYIILDKEHTIPTPETAQDYVIGAEKNYQNLKDGTWYFYIRGELSDGSLTLPSGYRVNIDSTPEVSSSSHPDQQKWYQSREVQMNWKIQDIPSAKAFYYILDDKPDTSPDKSKATKTNETSLNTMLPSDGEWYFHLVWEDEVGSLSKTAHYKLAVDATPLEPVTQLSVLLTEEGNMKLSWVESKDNASGVANYQIFRSKFSGAIGVSVGTDITEMEFIDKTVEKGQVYYYTVMPVDKAGNKQVNGNVQISTEDAPTEGMLSIQPFEGHVGDELEVSGLGFEAGEQVKVKLGDVEVAAKAGEDGSFKATLKVPTLAGGKHFLVAEGGNRKVEGWFEVKGRVSEITPSKVPVGSVVTVVGDGFAESAKVSVMIGGEVTSIIRGKETTSDGRLSVDVVVPEVGLGIQTLTVGDGQSEVKSSIQVIEGEPTDIYQTELSLTKGVNMISLPLNPETSYTASTLAAALNSTIVIQVKDGLFDAYVRAGSVGNDFPIQMGKGYIVNLMEAQTFNITGKAWGEPVPAAPSTSTSVEPWAFVIAGWVEGEVPKGSQLRATNLRTKESVIGPISPSGQFTAAFVDMNRRPVIAQGDEIIIQIIGMGGVSLTEAKRYIISHKELDQAYLLAHLSAKVEKTQLLQNYPNPFNPETWIPYQLSSDGVVRIAIYDINGALVRQLDMGHRKAGYYIDRLKATYWDGRNASGEKVASGLYFYQLTAGDFTATRRMVILKLCTFRRLSER